MRTASFVLATLIALPVPALADAEDAAVEVASAAITQAASFNHPITGSAGKDGHRQDVVRFKAGITSSPLYDAEGRPLGPPLEHFYRGGLRIQGLEATYVPGKGAFYYVWGDRPQLSGFVPLSVLARRPRIDPSGRNGNGKRARGGGRRYVVRPAAIPKTMRFDAPRFETEPTLATYGQPGGAQYPDYTYLMWNAPNVDGGGIVRSILRSNEVFTAAAVRRITIPALTGGSVTFMYGFVRHNRKRIYGWTVARHAAPNGTVVPHVAPTR